MNLNKSILSGIFREIPIRNKFHQYFLTHFANRTICNLRKYQHFGARFYEVVEFGAVQRCVTLVNLKKMLQTEPSVTKVGFDTAENGALKVCKN